MGGAGVSRSVHHLTGLPGNGVHGFVVSIGLSAHFRETSVDRKRSSCYLKTLLHLGVPDAFS